MNELDKHWNVQLKDVCFGLISDFGRLSDETRRAFLVENHQLARELFWNPIGEALSLYPDAPCHWLVAALRQPEDHIDHEKGLALLRELVTNLLDKHGAFATRVRMAPCRPLENRRIHFMKDLSVLELLPRYPSDLDEEDRLHVESFVRAAMMALYAMRDELKDWTWSKYFWRHNYDLAVCRSINRDLPEGLLLTDAGDFEALRTTMTRALDNGQEYLMQLQSQLRIDLYDPTRDEVLFGLFARITRLFLLLLEDPNLWARDIGSIIVRCLADTAITFGYLVRRGSAEEFQKFVQYGEGQQKLLMLQLQDNYPAARSPEGLDVEEIEKQFAVIPEFIDIELGQWNKKDSRILAKDAGMEKLYRLVFQPTSGDLHGNWASLRNSHLTYCDEPLHRFHRLPSNVQPPFYVAVAETARLLYEECREIAVTALRYPAFEPTETFLPPWEQQTS
jgi:hypothetical protein